MNPYEPPSVKDVAKHGTQKEEVIRSGRPCPSCESVNTSTDSMLRSRPSVLAVILFGWIFLLARGAFARRSSVCRDCGEVHRYKSVGSWIALVCLALLVALVAMALFVDPA
jgi:hypothetical protein